MTIPTIILTAAKAAKVSGSLLLAICSYESMDFKITINPNDGGTPSVGICHIKQETAESIGFKGTIEELKKPMVNAKWAARYLAWQMTRYGDDWCKLTSAYNAGSYSESKKVPGYPRNLKYVRRVQKKLVENLQFKLSCDRPEYARIDAAALANARKLEKVSKK